MNTHPIKQHYIPQFYLKKFSLNKKNFFKLDKTTNEILNNISIRTTAQEKKFYDISFKKVQIKKSFFQKYLKEDNNIYIEKEDNIIITLEYWFAKLESLIANNYNNILINNNYSLSYKSKKILSMLCSLLLNRGIQSRFLFNKKVYKKIYSKNLKKYIYPLPNENKHLFYQKLKKLSWFMAFIDGIGFAQSILLKKTFQILTIDPLSINSLCTSDNPIVFYNTKAPNLPLGISTPHTQIYLSLSPYKVLRIFNPNEYPIIQETLKDEDITLINKLYYQQSKKYIFSRDYNSLLSLKNLNK